MEGVRFMEDGVKDPTPRDGVPVFGSGHDRSKEAGELFEGGCWSGLRMALQIPGTGSGVAFRSRGGHSEHTCWYPVARCCLPVLGVRLASAFRCDFDLRFSFPRNGQIFPPIGHTRVEAA